MNIQIGDKSSISKRFTLEDVSQFSRISEDTNPIHFDEDYAAKTRFKKCIVQGPMVASLIGGVLGSHLPGNGTIYISQSSRFLKPVYVDELITAQVEVVSIRADKPIITLRTWVTNEYGEIPLDGEAVVYYIDN